MQLDAVAGQKLARGNDVLSAGVASQGDDRRMLQQKQGMAGASFFNQADERLLQLQRGGLVHAAEVERVDHAEEHRSILAIGDAQ
jgi:hypothetical protein